jgi:hypothetical protein
LDPNAWFIFDLKKESFFIKRAQQKEINPLNWKGGPMFMMSIPILSGPLLEVNCFTPFFLPSAPHPLLAKRTFFYTQTTLPCLLLLSGTEAL